MMFKSIVKYLRSVKYWDYKSGNIILDGKKIYANYFINDLYIIVNDNTNFIFAVKNFYKEDRYTSLIQRYPFYLLKSLELFRRWRCLVAPLSILIYVLSMYTPFLVLYIPTMLLINYLYHMIGYGELIREINRIRKKLLKDRINESIEIEKWIRVKSDYLKTIK